MLKLRDSTVYLLKILSENQSSDEGGAASDRVDSTRGYCIEEWKREEEIESDFDPRIYQIHFYGEDRGELCRGNSSPLEGVFQPKYEEPYIGNRLSATMWQLPKVMRYTTIIYCFKSRFVQEFQERWGLDLCPIGIQMLLPTNNGPPIPQTTFGWMKKVRFT